MIRFCLFIVLMVGLLACNEQAVEEQSALEIDFQIMTVTGPVPASQLGSTLAHEHVLVDWIGAEGTGYHRWERDEVVRRMLPYFLSASDEGIQTLFECTPAYLGRDPFILRELADRSGILIITNTGYYGAVDNHFMPAHAWEESAEELADRWIDEFENGIDGSDIRPGFMKISVSGEGALSELHQKIVKAAALTHLETGLTILSHTTGDDPAIEQVNLLKEQGVSPTAWVWTHAQAGTLETQIELGREGAWISLDNFHHNPEADPGEEGNLEWFLDRISDLKDAGLLDQVLISHDAGYYNPDEEDGGEIRGYTDIHRYLIPELSGRGFSENDVEMLLVQNPREAFGIRVRGYRE